MICKFCLKEKKLIKCHIIPRSFWKPILEPHALIISNNSKYYPKISQTGIYDENLICNDCEVLFSPFDYYAYRLLLTDIPSDNILIHNGEKIAYFINKYDYKKLKLFFVSLFWRVSASYYTYFESIKARSFENRLKEMILEQDPGSEDEFSIALRRFEKKSYSTAMLSPCRKKIDGINFVKLYLSDFTGLMKVDKRLAPDDIREVSLKENNPLWILLTDIKKSSEFSIMKKLAEKNRDKLGK